MFATKRLLALTVALALSGPAAAAATTTESEITRAAADRIMGAIEEPALRQLVSEVLRRNPEIAVAEARARAAGQRAPQVRALPNPTVGLTGFVESPETRTGPQQVAVGFSQSLPWRGKLALKERAALHEAASLEAEVDAKRLALVTEARRLFYELLYLDRRRLIGEELLDHLSQHEEIARARYSTGVGRGQGVVKIHAEITLAEKDLLDIRRARIGLEARINAMRDSPPLRPVLAEGMPEMREVAPGLEQLLDQALRGRPELVAAGARVRRARSRVELAGKARRPDFSVGVTYTVVDPRDDAPGRLQPPAGNGDDIVGIRGGISLPVWRKSLRAGVEEAVEHETLAQEGMRSARTAIVAAVGDLVQRVELDWRQLRLIDDLLIVQAEESAESALAGYIAGRLDALELLDAEHVRFQAHTALARAQADYLIAIAELEGATGAPLETGREAVTP